jgi:polygalacturonase
MARDNDRFSSRSIGFSARGTNMLFEDNVVINGDDCLAVISPARDIHFRNSYCNGGHGLSIGSLGKGGAVADVQNVLYVVRILVGSGPLTSRSKDRERCHGES